MSKYVMYFGIAFIVLTLLFGISEKTTIGTTETTMIEALFNPPLISQLAAGNWTGAIGSIFDPTWLQTLWKVMWFDYGILNQGWFVLFRYIFICISLGFVVSLISLLLVSFKINNT